MKDFFKSVLKVSFTVDEKYKSKNILANANFSDSIFVKEKRRGKEIDDEQHKKSNQKWCEIYK